MKDFSEAYQKIKNAYEHKPVKNFPIVLMDAPYWISGQKQQDVPKDYFTSPASMCTFQHDNMVKHLETVNDCYIPFLLPWYGTGVIPSAFGCSVSFYDNEDPGVSDGILTSPDQISSLQMPNFEKDGLMPRVSETIRYMRANYSYPVYVTDPQGPLNIALTLCGLERLCYWMYDYPDQVHELMDFCSTVFIEWIRYQKKLAEAPLHSGAFPHGIILPEGFGGISLADDDCVVLSAELYKKFVVPYNGKVLKAFGGGTIHFCGTAEHQLDNFLATEGLTGINNFCMGNFKQIKAMQEKFKDKIALMVCDFTPYHIERYYTELLGFLKPQGTILATYPAPLFALENGKYENIVRDTVAMTTRFKSVIQKITGIEL